MCGELAQVVECLLSMQRSIHGFSNYYYFSFFPCFVLNGDFYCVVTRFLCLLFLVEFIVSNYH